MGRTDICQMNVSTTPSCLTQHKYIRSPGEKTVERNEWVIFTLIHSITNISFCYFADNITMDSDYEMMDDDHLQLLFADSPELSDNEQPALPAEDGHHPAPPAPLPPPAEEPLPAPPPAAPWVAEDPPAPAPPPRVNRERPEVAPPAKTSGRRCAS